MLGFKTAVENMFAWVIFALNVAHNKIITYMTFENESDQSGHYIVIKCATI